MSLRIGSVGYACKQGIGYLPKFFYDNGIITDMMVFRHSSRETHMEWYPPGTMQLVGRPFSGPSVEKWLENIDCLLIFETPFDWQFLLMAKLRGVKTVLMPMYECTPRQIPHQPDLYLNPSLLDQQYFPQGTYLPVPVDPSTWRLRTSALKFLHNGGHLGLRGHKGTLELLQAMQYVKSPITLTVRAQDDSGLRGLIARCPHVLGDSRITFEFGDIPYENLFKDHDVLIAAEKYNGLSLPLQEARAAGMLVMTSDRFPHNAWLPQYPLIPVSGTSRQCVSGAYLEYDEALIRPEDIAATIDKQYGTDIEEYSLTGRIWADENSWESLKPRYMEVFEQLCDRKVVA